jgi:transposase
MCLDMHKDKIVGFISGNDGSGQELKEFGIFNCELNDVKAWLQGHHVEHCLMESTGIYWMSLYAILTEAGIHVTVANPTHIKQVPKRKTDRRCQMALHPIAERIGAAKLYADS